MSALRIDVVSDVICPWCLIGTRRLDEAVEGLQGVDAKVTYRPFLLDPTTPPEGQDLRERLRRKYGADPETMFARVEEAAKSSGIPLDFAKVRKTVSTVRAHTLLRHAIEKGTQRELAHRLFDAYFLEGKDIGDPSVLADLAASMGFEPSEAVALVTNESELRETREEASQLAAEGIRGVPFFIFQGRIAVSGAQPVDVLQKAAKQALSTAA